MRMVQIICGKRLKDEAKSELILKMTDVEPFKKFSRNQRLRWFKHIKRISKEKTPAMSMKIMVKEESS